MQTGHKDVANKEKKNREPYQCNEIISLDA